MPEIELAPNTKLFYRDDDVTDPWRPGDAMLLMHGYGENSLAWNSWMPQLSRRFRVIRPDMRGYGRSTPTPLDYPWSVDGVIADYVKLMDALGIRRFHLAGAKIGGTMSLRFAALHPDRVLSLIALASRVTGRATPGGGQSLDDVDQAGVEKWARDSMEWRLGKDAPRDLLDGWSKLMGVTPITTLRGFAANFPAVDLRADLPKIACPTLVITNQGNNVSSVEDIRAWQKTIPNSELLVLPGQSMHVSATDGEACARAAIEFIDRSGVGVPAG